MKERVRSFRRKIKISQKKWKQKNDWEKVKSFTGLRNLKWWYKIKIINFISSKATKVACWKFSKKTFSEFFVYTCPQSCSYFQVCIIFKFQCLRGIQKFSGFNINIYDQPECPSSVQVPQVLECRCALSIQMPGGPNALSLRVPWVTSDVPNGTKFDLFCPMGRSFLPK